MNMQNLMAQAQKVQRELEKVTKEIEESTFEGQSGAIKITMKGNMVVNKVEVIDTNALSDKELLEDMVMVAMNDALNKIAKVKEEKLGKYTGGLGGLF